MKKIVLLMCSVSMVIGLALIIGSPEIRSEVGTGHASETADNALPASLSNFYPPAVDQPVYLFKMLGLAEPYAGIVADLFEDDYENLDKDVETFRTRYIEISNMVPEWKDLYPMEPLDNLKAAIPTRDKGKIMAAFEEVDGVCQRCHLPNLARVHFAYRWPRFQEIKLIDPLTKGEIRYKQLMQFLETNITGIGLDVQQGQIENARTHLRAFRTRFEYLSEVCMDCHDTERYYYVDADVIGILDKIEQSLNEKPVNPQVVGGLIREFGTDSCLKCHLVHGPAGMAQLREAE